MKRSEPGSGGRAVRGAAAGRRPRLSLLLEVAAIARDGVVLQRTDEAAFKGMQSLTEHRAAMLWTGGGCWERVLRCGVTVSAVSRWIYICACHLQYSTLIRLSVSFT